MKKCTGRLEDCGALTHQEYLDGECHKCKNILSISELKDRICCEIDNNLNNGLHWKTTAKEIVNRVIREAQDE